MPDATGGEAAEMSQGKAPVASALAEIPGGVLMAQRFEDVRCAENSSMRRSGTIASTITILPDDRHAPGGG